MPPIFPPVLPMVEGDLLGVYTFLLFTAGFGAGFAFRALWGADLRKEWRELERRRKEG